VTKTGPAHGHTSASAAWQRALLWGTLGGLGAVAALAAAVLLRYPGGPRARMATLVFAALAYSAVAVLAYGAWWSVRRATSAEARVAQTLGAIAGLCAGAIWLVEISFNNLLPPELSVPQRDQVDNIFWLATVVLMLGAAGATGYLTGRARDGMLAGAWSGLLSGLLACLYGLGLVVFRLDLILRDPLAQAEFAQRGPASLTPDMATYFARDTAAGAFGHLALLGVIAGLLLGAIGGGGGALAARWRRRDA
jgi:hypothetical protein